MFGKTSGQGVNIVYEYEYELRTKQKFYLYLYEVCPSIEIIDILWNLYIQLNNEAVLKFYQSISPFQPHPCGNDCIFKTVCGYIDSDVFVQYYKERENILKSIKIVGDPYFLCKYTRARDEMENTPNYFANLINESQIKLSKLNRCKVFEQVILYLFTTHYHMNIDQVIAYLSTRQIMYNNMKVLFAYPIGIDCNDELCQFE